MTPRSLFIIILKVLGIFFIKDILAAIPQVISSVFILAGSTSEALTVWTLVFSAIVLSVYVCISYFLIFRSQSVIDSLKLDQGFDQEVFAMNMPRASIMKMAIIVTALFILATEIPDLCGLVFLFFEQDRSGFMQTRPEIWPIIFSAAKIVIALLFIGERKRIVEFVEERFPAVNEEEMIPPGTDEEEAKPLL